VPFGVVGDGGHSKDSVRDPRRRTDQSTSAPRHLLHRGPRRGTTCLYVCEWL